MATKQTGKTNYKKIGLIAALVIAIAVGGFFAIRYFNRGMTVSRIMEGVSGEAVTGADLRIAVVRMDEVTGRANALVDLRRQKESYESKLKSELEREQKALEKEKAEIEKSQDVLSREALQRRVQEYQQRIARLQRDVSERAQSIEASFQQALGKVQERDLNPIIEGIIAKKNLSLVIDGRFARVSSSAPASLDITDDVINSLDKKISSTRMDTPKGF